VKSDSGDGTCNFDLGTDLLAVVENEEHNLVRVVYARVSRESVCLTGRLAKLGHQYSRDFVVGDASEVASSSIDFEVALSGRVLTIRTWSRYVDTRFNMIWLDRGEDGSGSESEDDSL
jgi:hypothetical protein